MIRVLMNFIWYSFFSIIFGSGSSQIINPNLKEFEQVMVKDYLWNSSNQIKIGLSNYLSDQVNPINDLSQVDDIIASRTVFVTLNTSNSSKTHTHALRSKCSFTLDLVLVCKSKQGWSCQLPPFPLWESHTSHLHLCHPRATS
jgi:hypothetical protein